jgi:hypothetical protein
MTSFEIIGGAAAAAALAATLAGCASAHHPAAASTQAAATAAAATAAPPPAPGLPTGPEPRICGKVRAIIPQVLNAVQHKHLGALERDGGKFAGWSHTALFAAHDSQFANYLADAGIELTLLASPTGPAYLHKAGVALGKVNGYCKYTVGVSMGS